MKKWLKITLPFAMLSISLVSTIPLVVSCAKFNDSVPLPPSQDQENIQNNINEKYRITGEFAKIYTEQMFNENIKLMKRFDGDNKLLMKIASPGSPVKWKLYERNSKCLLFSAKDNTIEIKIKVENNQSSELNPSKWYFTETYEKFIFDSNNNIRHITNIKSDFGNINVTDQLKLNNQQFKDKINSFTNKGWDDFIKSNNFEWQD